MLTTKGGNLIGSRPSASPEDGMAVVTITQLHKVAQAQEELTQLGHKVVGVSGGGPWRITYEEAAKPKKSTAKKPDA